MSITQADAYELTKAQLTQTQRLMKSRPARKFLKKRQLERGGVGNGFYKTQARGPTGENPGEMKKADGYIRTIYDMIDYWYGFYPEYAGGGGVSKGLEKDNTVTTSDGAWRNAVHGSEVFSLLNSEANAFALLENRAWVRSGERAVDDRAANNTHTLGSGGTAEDGSLPNTDHPGLVEFTQTPKTVAHNFDVSQVKQLLADTEDDDLEDPFDWLRRWYGTGTEHQSGMGEHPKHINSMLLTDVTTTAGNDVESIDRAISNSADESNNADAGDADIYGFDRSSNNFESNVEHNSGTDETFTIDMLNDLIRTIKESSGKNPVSDENYFFLTGHDTYQRIEEEVGGKERLEAVRTTVGLNGVNTNPGDDVGITVRAYKNIPIFESNDVPSDTISHIYLIDSSTMWLKTLLPTQFYSTGTEIDGNPFGIDVLANEGMYVSIMELTLTNPAAQAKRVNLA